MNGNSESGACLDGAAVKRIREARKLTQLYVSKVVGVTTDTVSRWENNRYPTIRRENALKLAEALDVPLDDLLRKTEEPEIPEEGLRARLPFVLMGLAVALVIAFAITFSMVAEPPPPPPSVTAQRILPEHAAPGATIPVMVNLTHRTVSDGFILREYFPKGWKLVQSSPPTSSLDNINGVARWIIKGGDGLDRVVYLVKASQVDKSKQEALFQGEIIIGSERSQASVTILGDTSIRVAPVHWADSNADGQIDDVEMLQASYTIEDMAGVHMDWNALERLWDAGGYRWDDRKKAYLPVSKENGVAAE